MSFRGTREFISPLLQPPLNKLFVPRPTPQQLLPCQKDVEKRRVLKLEATATYLQALLEPVLQEEATIPKAAQKAMREEEKKRQKVEELEAGIAAYKPIEDAGSDAFKTLFVARLPYDVTESRVRREFERFGPVKSVGLCGASDC